MSLSLQSASPGTGDDDTGRGERGVPVDERPLLAKSPSQREAEARAELFAQVSTQTSAHNSYITDAE